MSNNSKFNFKNSLKSNTKEEEKISISSTNTINENEVQNDNIIQEEATKKFRIGRKQEDKSNKTQFPLYIDKEKQKQLDKVAKKTGYSRNELINMMIDFCLENLEFQD